ncbi:phosphoenolpyruvate synthase [Candidatus Roizmanbacteria bacterium]|nr:phosphoenolpyruvate synthase [Candidatus Roizmanbacteria bacterium]
MANKKSIVWFEEVGKGDVGIVGGKGANLGEMTNARLPVPYGFIVTAEAYFDFIEKAGLKKRISDLLQSVNFENPSELSQASSLLKELIDSAPLPNDLVKQIIRYYDELIIKENHYFNRGAGLVKQGLSKVKSLYTNPLVAVRSSATAEDLPGASFAGQQETYLNVRGEAHLLTKIRECYASLFTERAIYYRHQQKFDHTKVGLAAVVQRMIQSDKSGIAFSIDPVTNDKNKIVIEAIYGLGEYIVQGKVTPDHYEVSKKSLVIIDKEVKKQSVKMIKSNIYNKEVRLGNEGSQQKLSDEEIIKVALLVADIEKHYFFPQDIEWAIENGQVYIVQSRPVTTTDKTNKLNKANKSSETTLTPILTGAPASPGIAVGPARIIYSPKEIGKVKIGDVLVATQTNPDYVPAMKKAVAIVTEKGGRTSHAAIVSRELGIPAVVGAERVTKIVKEGEVITVNGASGEIFKGKAFSPTSKKAVTFHKKLQTATKVYTNLAEPEQALKVSKMHVDGIGLLRAEFIFAQIGIHPKQFVKEKKQDLFISRLSRDLLKFVTPFSPRPVIYRATDFRTNEFRNLKGGKEFEPYEENPMLGFRGAFRYISNPEVFNLELQSIKKVWEKGYRNLHLMIPFIRTTWELIKIKQLVEKSGLFNYPDFKLWIMVEVPATALGLEEFIKIGIDGVSIGTNDLTMMLLGVDRDNEEVATVYDERTPVVLSVLEYIVKTCQKYGVTCSICGQAPSDYPEIVEKLVKAGITSLSVTPDVIERTRQNVFDVEKKLFLQKKK